MLIYSFLRFLCLPLCFACLLDVYLSRFTQSFLPCQNYQLPSAQSRYSALRPAVCHLAERRVYPRAFPYTPVPRISGQQLSEIPRTVQRFVRPFFQKFPHVSRHYSSLVHGEFRQLVFRSPLPHRFTHRFTRRALFYIPQQYVRPEYPRALRTFSSAQ